MPAIYWQLLLLVLTNGALVHRLHKQKILQASTTISSTNVRGSCVIIPMLEAAGECRAQEECDGEWSESSECMNGEVCCPSLAPCELPAPWIVGGVCRPQCDYGSSGITSSCPSFNECCPDVPIQQEPRDLRTLEAPAETSPTIHSDCKAYKVALFGDSQMEGELGKALKKYFENLKYTVLAKVVKTGAAISKIAALPDIVPTLEKHPQIIFISGGGNSESKEKTTSAAFIKKILSFYTGDIPPPIIFWSGPPPAVDWRTLEDHNEVFANDRGRTEEQVMARHIRKRAKRRQTNRNLKEVLVPLGVTYFNPDSCENDAGLNCDDSMIPYPTVYKKSIDGIHLDKPNAEKYAALMEPTIKAKLPCHI
jgi:hypothetical protein